MIWGRERTDPYGAIISSDLHNNWVMFDHFHLADRETRLWEINLLKIRCLPIIDLGLIPGPLIPNTMLSLPYCSRSQLISSQEMANALNQSDCSQRVSYATGWLPARIVVKKRDKCQADSG